MNFEIHPPCGKVYLGDGAYCEYDGFHLVLTTEDGIRVRNTVCLEPEFIAQLIGRNPQMSLAHTEPRAVEAGLVKNGRGIRTWFAQDFDGVLPGLDHPKIQEAMAIEEENEKS